MCRSKVVINRPHAVIGVNAIIIQIEAASPLPCVYYGLSAQSCSFKANERMTL